MGASESTSGSSKNMRGQEPKLADNHDDLVKPIYENGRYKNPFDTFEERGFSHVWRMLREVSTNDKSDVPWNDKDVSFNFCIFLYLLTLTALFNFSYTDLLYVIFIY